MIVNMKYLITLLTALIAATGSAQDIPLRISGQVTDASTKEPIPYASVHIDGTMTGVSTDGEGNYFITMEIDGTLVFSSIGYKTRKVVVKGPEKLDVALEPDTEVLDETIVVAYGTATRRSFTGSASMVGAETIE